MGLDECKWRCWFGGGGGGVCVCVGGGGLACIHACTHALEIPSTLACMLDAATFLEVIKVEVTEFPELLKSL